MITTALNTPDDNPTTPRQSTTPSSRRTPRGATQNSNGETVNSHKNPQPGATSHTNGTPRKSTWQRQLLAVDFRHAFWPWATCMFGMFMLYYGAWNWQHETHPHYVWNSWAVVLVAFTAPAAAMRVFCTDFDHGTTARLLSAPISRTSIWITKIILSAALLGIPAIFTHILVPSMSWRYLIGDGVGQKPYTTSILYFCWCAWSFAPLLSLFLRRAILAWTATAISPLLVAIVAGVLFAFFGIDALSPALFPYVPNDVLITAILLGLAAQILAAYLWRRLEVRQ